MLKYRLITGPILILVVVAVFWLDNVAGQFELQGWMQSLFVGRRTLPDGIVLFLAGLAIAALAGVELSGIFRAKQIMTRPWLTSLAAMLGLVVSYVVPAHTEAITAVAIVATGMIVVFVGSLLTFSRQQNVQGVVAAAGAVVFAMVYLGLMFGFFLALRRGHSAFWILGVILVTKSCDTGAYFTGRAIGKHKMIPWLSPGKTWEGLAGGIAASTLVGVLLAWASQAWLDPGNRVALPTGAVCGLVFGLVGQFGDLTMSLFKRDAGLKDSSSVLPGMGGVLDVLDSPLMVAPVAYWMLAFSG